MNDEIREIDKTIAFLRSHIEEMESYVAEKEEDIAQLVAKRSALMVRKYATKECMVDPTDLQHAATRNPK